MTNATTPTGKLHTLFIHASFKLERNLPSRLEPIFLQYKVLQPIFNFFSKNARILNLFKITIATHEVLSKNLLIANQFEVSI